MNRQEAIHPISERDSASRPRRDAEVGEKWKVQRGVFHSVVALQTAIKDFVEQHRAGFVLAVQ